MPVNESLRPVIASLNSHRVLLYSFISTVAVSAAVANALKSHSNFYSVAIYLSKSSRSVLILANFGCLIALLCGHIVQQVFFGPLRPPEIERLYDRLWFFVTESLLAFTIFRDDFDIPFALMFGFLLFVKSFHWLAADRIEWMDQRPYPGPPLLFHIRMTGLFVILYSTDFLMFIIAAEHTMTNGIGGMVLFASEYAVLMASVLNTIAKYILSAIELRRAGSRGGENAPPWENKSMWVFYIELITDFLKLTTYLVFFTVIITFYGLPLNIVRDVYITARSFVTRLRALHRYQTATRNMDQRYPNATEEEMAAMTDRTCIICREEMLLRNADENRSGDVPQQAPVPVPDGPNMTPKKLPCGHIFHFHCLRSWLERQQSCPTCRRSVLEPNSTGQLPAGDARGPGVPHPPNQFGVPGLQPGLNNPLGIVGRLFGAAAQHPVGAGQFPNGQLPPQPAANIPQNPAQFGVGPGQHAPPGVIIQYHFQYVPRHYPPLPAPVPHQPLQPVPPFVGFQGPGGLWQPWGMPQRWLEARQNPPQPDPPRVPSTAPTQIAVPTPTPTQPQSRPRPPSPAASSVTHSPISNDSEGPSTPRDAAAFAALRRFNTTSTRRPNSGPTGTSASAGNTSGEPGASSVPLPSSPDPGPNDLPNSGIPGPNGRLDIPMMIPLYDYGPSGSHLNYQVPPVYSPHASIPHGPSPPLYRTPPGVRQPSYFAPQQMPSGSHIQTGNQRSLPIPSTPWASVDPRHAQSRTPISQLPPVLTEDQLALMDRVTREAIDERLRVLEGVSGAVYRCIDDLVRVRSALPTPMPIPVAPPSPRSSSTSPLNSDASSSIKCSPVTNVSHDGIAQESISSGSGWTDAVPESPTATSRDDTPLEGNVEVAQP